ncbi:alpha/beta hydrolase family protein [Microtetraspora malaysiensis]|uniref:alpha/beta hydrolase family protein n=1 Tax=Microtetraspora malaysiensis TaxID=161358 RepID=UPI000A4A84E7|nr:alpha/beta hydrolase [Microtetraspora malaysiensis]
MSKTINRGALAAGFASVALAMSTTAAGAAEPVPSAPSAAPASTPAPSPSTTRRAVQASVLPRPTGPHRVGTTTLHLVDGSRPDPWVPSVKKRELMVSLWYPAKPSGGRRAPYMTAEESTLLLKEQKITGVPSDVLSRTRTNAIADAAPTGRRNGLPLVVLSPGFTWPRSSLTTLAEDLASRGYVVAGIDHTYESFGTSLPGGRTATCVACPGASGDPIVFGAKAAKGRQADVSFVLDRLTGRHAVWKGSELIDRSRIGMAGHSLGGASTSWTMVNDSRVRAGINMDGTFFVPIPKKGLSRPFLMLGASGGVPGEDPTWDRAFERMTGWKRWLSVEGAGHGSFTDYSRLSEQIGVDLGTPLKGARAVEITREYVAAFFDQHLRRRPQSLLDRPSRRYPEARFWR